MEHGLQAATNAGALAVGVLTGKLGHTELSGHAHGYILAGVKDLPQLAEIRP